MTCLWSNTPVTFGVEKNFHLFALEVKINLYCFLEMVTYLVMGQLPFKKSLSFIKLQSKFLGKSLVSSQLL